MREIGRSVERYLIPCLLLAFLAGVAVIGAPRAALADGYDEGMRSGDRNAVLGGVQPGRLMRVADDAAPPPASAPALPPLSAAPTLSDKVAQENVFWESVQKSNTVADYQAYIDSFPNGVYAPLAKNRIAAMTSATPAPDAGQPSPMVPAQSPSGAPQPEPTQQSGAGVAAPPAVSPEALKAEIGTVETEQALNLNRQDQMVLQRRLSALGLYPGPIDGDIGPASREAIAEWQRRHELTPTGELGPLQLAALRAESAPVNGQRVEGGGCPPGFHLGPYGRRCWVNR